MEAKTLDKIKKELLKKKQELEKELAQFAEKDIHNKADYQAIFPDYGSKDEENIAEVAAFSDRLSLENTLEKVLADVNDALGRIKKGIYGVCKYCRKEIPKERLSARPTSSSCVACKESLKKNK